MNSSKHEASPALHLGSFVERVTEIMPRLCQAMIRHESNHLTSGKLALPQFWALELLRERGACTMHDLAGSLQLKSSTGTVFVDRLNRMGLVRRAVQQSDRRVVLVELTAKGRRVLEEIHGQKKQSMTELFRPLTIAERGAYLSLLEKLARELSPPNEEKR